MFLGTFNHNIDSKNRLIIPSKFREEIGENATMTIGHDHCIVVYTQESWKTLEEKLKSYDLNSSLARKQIRLIAGSASSFTVDPQGRVVLPSNLLKHSNINKEVVIVGNIDYIEIWSKENWDAYYDEASEDYDSISEQLV